jgi:galactosamine-6-phosphate isomerase
MVQPEDAAGGLRACECLDYEAMSRQAAALIMAELRLRPHLLLCAAAGSTPTRAYDLLAGRKQTEPSRFNELRVLKLDEWGGLALDHPATCESYLQRYLIRPLQVPQERYIAFRSDSHDPHVECERLRIEFGKQLPIDLCVLGLGANGHLGLNEPGESLRPFAHVATLSETSLKHPMLRSVDGRVPYGLTLGMAEIMQSRKVLLLVSGARKSRQLQRLLRSEISSHFPGSYLWLHPDVTVLYDRESARGTSLEG